MTSGALPVDTLAVVYKTASFKVMLEGVPNAATLPTESPKEFVPCPTIMAPVKVLPEPANSTIPRASGKAELPIVSVPEPERAESMVKMPVVTRFPEVVTSIVLLSDIEKVADAKKVPPERVRVLSEPNCDALLTERIPA